MNRYAISLIAIMATIIASAKSYTIECQPGQLSSLATQNDITELEIKGHMDARDFRFIADSMRQLTSLDLSQATIDAFAGVELFANKKEFAANELPAQSLAGMADLRQLVLPTDLTCVGAGSLSGCTALTQLQMPERTRVIGSFALSGCTALTRVTVTPSLSSISDGAFTNCTSLTTITMTQPQGSTAGLSSQSLSIGYRAFANCPNLTTVELGNTWKDMDDEAFAETGLKQLNLSEQSLLTSLPDWSFAQSDLQTLKLPNALTTIGDGALLYDASIATLELPGSVDSIGAYAMAMMTGLQELKSKPQRVPELGENVWADVDQPEVKLIVSKSSIDDYQSAEQWCEFFITSDDAIPGDVNGDGTVDIADVNAAINVMLGKESNSKYDGRADINGDGIVDIADVNAVINYMLGRQRAIRKALEEEALRQNQQVVQKVNTDVTPTALGVDVK